jgi:ABC-type lipoprotein release transport system permease subunit
VPFVARLLLETTCSLVEDLAVAAPMIAALLYGTRAIDPLIFLAVPLVLLVVSFAASYIPARRAAKVSPIVALREG